MAGNLNDLTAVQLNDIKQDEYWTHRLLEMIKLEKSNFVFTTLGKPDELPKKQGTKTKSYRRYNSLPVDLTVDGQGLTLTEGVAPTPLKVEAQKVSGSVDQFGAFIKETDVADAIHFDDIKSIYQPELARHAAEVTERNVISKLVEGNDYTIGVNGTVALTDPSQLDAGTLNSYGTADTTPIMTLQDLRKVWLTMKNYRRKGHTKFGGKPVVVMHCNVMQDLLDDEDLKDRLLIPGNENTPIKSGTLQQYMAYGMNFVETLICPTQSSFDYLTNTALANEAAIESTGTNDGRYVGEYIKDATGVVFEINTVAAATCTATAVAAGDAVNVYTSYMLGKDPYVVLALGKKGLEWKMRMFTADSNDPLGQTASFGYKMWTGAKVIDPMAITQIYSTCSYDITPDFSSDSLGDSATQD